MIQCRRVLELVLYYLSKQYCVREILTSLITALYLDINDHIMQRISSKHKYKKYIIPYFIQKYE